MLLLAVKLTLAEQSLPSLDIPAAFALATVVALVAQAGVIALTARPAAAPAES